MYPWLEWVFWIGGGTLVGGGIWLAAWGLFRDLPRGRRRCPRCWYDMTETPGLVCNECGKAVKRERVLRKIRRKWWMIRLGVLMLVLGGAAIVTPRVREGGWYTATPTTLLVLAMPALEDLAPDAAEDLKERFRSARPWRWQWALLIGRLWDVDPFCEVELITRTRWPEGVPLACVVDYEMGLRTFPWLHTDVRLRVEPRYDRDARPAYWRADGWFAPDVDRMSNAARHALRLGVPPAGARELQFDVAVEMRAPSGAWKTIHTQRERLAIDVGGLLEEFADPMRDDGIRETLAARTTFELDNRALTVRLEDDGRLPADLELPVVLVLRRDGDTVVTWTGWWRHPRPPAVWRHELPQRLTGADRPFGTRGYARQIWSVLVRGDASRAVLRDDDRPFWHGEFEVPLRLVDTPDELAYVSRPAP